MTRERIERLSFDCQSGGAVIGEPAAGTCRIETAEQYRAAVEEVQRLQQAHEGTPEFARRQALRAALADYELRRLPTRPPGVG